jgi:hypothetical protein
MKHNLVLPQTFWSKWQQRKKIQNPLLSQVFTNDKFMLSASPAALRSLTHVAEKVIVDPTLLCATGKEVAHIDRWFRAVVVALTSDNADTR